MSTSTSTCESYCASQNISVIAMSEVPQNEQNINKVATISEDNPTANVETNESSINDHKHEPCVNDAYSDDQNSEVSSSTSTTSNKTSECKKVTMEDVYYICNLCAKSFQTMKEIGHHRETQHPSADQGEKTFPSWLHVFFNIKLCNSVVIWECKICHLTFSYMDQVKEHAALHPECKSYLVWDGKGDSVINEPFKCNLCKKAFGKLESV